VQHYHEHNVINTDNINNINNTKIIIILVAVRNNVITFIHNT